MWILGRSQGLRCNAWVVECISTTILYSTSPRGGSNGSALQIFQDLSHPSALSNSVVARRSNEGIHLKKLIAGLSLFSLLAHTNTPQGSATLRQWFLSPLQSVEAIIERQNTIAFFEDNVIAEQVHDIRMGLKKMGDVHSGLNTIRRGGDPSSR